MKSQILNRNLGNIGMAGALLWILSLILEYSLGLQPPAGEGLLYIANQLLAVIALVCVAVGYFGIKSSGGVTTRFGNISVWLFSVGYFLIVLGGIFALALKADDSPIFILLPLGGLLMALGAIFTGFSVMKANTWLGWRRYMPLIYAAYLWLAIMIPNIVGFYSDGPGFVPELFQGIGLFLVGLAALQEFARKNIQK